MTHHESLSPALRLNLEGIKVPFSIQKRGSSDGGDLAALVRS